MARAIGEALRVLGGLLCKNVGLFSPALSVLERSFRGGALGRVVPLPRSVLVELRVARALLFITGSNFWRNFAKQCSAPMRRRQDPSSLSRPLVRGKLGHCRCEERWRFWEIASQSELAPSFVSELGLGPSQAPRRTAALLAQGGRSDVAVLEGTSPAVPSHVLDLGRWRLTVAGAWREASRTRLLLGLLRACSQWTVKGRMIANKSCERRALNALCRLSLA